MELPWALGPPDGRYLLRHRDGGGAEVPDAGAAGAGFAGAGTAGFGAPAAGAPGAATHVLVLSTLGATPRRQRLIGRRARELEAKPQPEPTPVATGRATVIDVAGSFSRPEDAAAWLRMAGEERLERDLAVLNWALHAFRVATADPYLNPVSREQLLVARVGYGAGEEVADGRWTEARELIAPVRRQRRARLLHPQARLARLLGGHEQPLVCEELALRARLDLDHGRGREAALQVMIALDAAIAELAADPAAEGLESRIDELRQQRDPVADAAQTALGLPLEGEQLGRVAFALERIEAALRARTLARE